MPELRNITYYRAREAFERDRALRSANDMIARIHIELADCYARVIDLDDGAGPETPSYPPADNCGDGEA